MLIKAGEKTFLQNRFVSGSQVIQAMSLVLKERSSSCKQNQILLVLAVDIYSQTEKIKHKRKKEVESGQNLKFRMRITWAKI